MGLTLLFAALVTVFVAWASLILYRLLHWRALRWVPGYLSSRRRRPAVRAADRHLIFLIVDHYEPGWEDKGLARHNSWVERYLEIIEPHRDAAGNRYRHSWFYPFDHHNEPVLENLCELAWRGYGEVELHWHVPKDSTSETFRAGLQEAIAWFQRYGALITSGPEQRTAFAYIAGKFNLNGTRPNDHMVQDQLQILWEAGCYADMSFPTIGGPTQPRTVNSLYYPEPHSGLAAYDAGRPAQVHRRPGTGPLLFQGPSAMSFLSGRLEYSAIEDFARPSLGRIRRWIDCGVHVQGRPEWTFVKLSTHSSQSRASLLHENELGRMLQTLEEHCRSEGITLHYASAREAYNIVAAAEVGHSGDPEAYRDYAIPRPLNQTLDPTAIRSRREERVEPAPVWRRGGERLEELGVHDEL